MRNFAGNTRRRGDRDEVEVAIDAALSKLGEAPAAARPWLDALRDLCVRGGKRLRPRLCALAYEGVAGKPVPSGVYGFAAGLELMHAFMLVHDDLIDGSALRRGAPTLHHRPELRHGKDLDGAMQKHAAMIAGDALFALSMEAMCRAELPAARAREAMAAVLATAREAALGELLDLLFGKSELGALESGELAEVLRLKTASYTFVGPLVAGAALAGAPPHVRRALESFGTRVGVAFQLADDLLDLFSTEAELGKPVGGDLREGKRTVLMRLALDRASPGDGRELCQILDAGQASDADLHWVRELLVRTEAASEVAHRVQQLVRAASRALGRAELRPEAASQLRALSARIVASLPQLEVAR